MLRTVANDRRFGRRVCDLADPQPLQWRDGPAGSKIVSARVARVGLQQYAWGAEFRSPDVVFDQDSLDSLVGVPVLWLHPDAYEPGQSEVNSANWQRLSAGHVRDGVRRDGDWIIADLQITRADLIDAIEAKQVCEVSCGYLRDLIRRPGSWRGQPYAYVQDNIVYNHVSLGPANWARAGRDARILLDSLWNNRTSMKHFWKQITITDSKKLHFDGKDYDPRDPTQVAGLVALYQAQRLPAADQLDPATVQQLLDQLTGALSQMGETIAMLQSMVAETPPEAPEAPEAGVTEMTMDAALGYVDLVNRARAMYPEIQIEGKTPAQVRREALEHVMPAGIPLHYNDDHIQGRFESMSLGATWDQHRAVLDSGIRPDSGGRSSIEAAKEKVRQNRRDRFNARRNQA